MKAIVKVLNIQMLIALGMLNGYAQQWTAGSGAQIYTTDTLVGIGTNTPSSTLSVYGNSSLLLPSASFGITLPAQEIRQATLSFDNITPVDISNSSVGGYWKIIFKGTWLNDWEGGTLKAPAPYIEVTSVFPTIEIGSITLTVSRDGTTGKLSGLTSSAVASKMIAFTGTMEIISATTDPDTKSLLLRGDVGIGSSNMIGHTGYSTISLNHATNGGVVDFRNNGSLVGQISNDASAFSLSTNTSVPLKVYTSGSLAGVVDPSQRWLLGYSSNQTGDRLQLDGNLTVGSDAWPKLTLLEGSTVSAQVLSRYALGTYFDGYSAQPIYFRTNVATTYKSPLTLIDEKVIINDITDNGSGAKLQVNGGGSFDGDLNFSGNRSINWGSSSNSFGIASSTGNGVLRLANTFTLTVNSHDAMYITSTGSVGIGTYSIPASAKLAVDGNLYARKVKVTQSSWPDYVFTDAYALTPLTEVAAYVKKHGHLRGFPSAEEVRQEGQDLGEVNKVLLQKVEEITLYLINMEKRINELQAENLHLQHEVIRLNSSRQ